MTLRCIIWAAVSTPQQANDQKESIPAQIEQARQVITQKGWQEVAEPLVVPGQSRNINWLDQVMKEIPAMQQLIDLAEAKKIDLVIVRDYDRLASTESLRVQISTPLREQGVHIIY
jgi:DNA invertase Pin-like site-specific DNA recombinase